MGDIADSIINGEFDSITGEYLGEPCGYPRSIYDKPNRNHQKNEGYNTAKRGIAMYVGGYGLKYRPIVSEYAESIGMDYSKIGLDKVCLQITADFDSFKEWFKTNHIND